MLPMRLAYETLYVNPYAPYETPYETPYVNPYVNPYETSYARIRRGAAAQTAPTSPQQSASLEARDVPPSLSLRPPSPSPSPSSSLYVPFLVARTQPKHFGSRRECAIRVVATRGKLRWIRRLMTDPTAPVPSRPAAAFARCPSPHRPRRAAYQSNFSDVTQCHVLIT